MDINAFDDRKNRSVPVRILADSPVMDQLIEAVLSPVFRRVQRGEALSVICREDSAPKVQGPCVFIGTAPETLGEGQVFLVRPLDIDELFFACVSLCEKRTSALQGGWGADTVKGAALFGTAEVGLTKKELELYMLLLSRLGECVPRKEIDTALWNGEVSGNCADVYICYLRKKLESIAGPGVLISVRGRGYMLKKP